VVGWGGVAGGWAYRLWIQTVPSPAQTSPAGWWGGVGWVGGVGAGAGDEPAACRFKLIPVQHGVVVGWVAGGIVSCRLKELDSTFRLVVGWAGLKP
jgi:hypothetical protein